MLGVQPGGLQRGETGSQLQRENPKTKMRFELVTQDPSRPTRHTTLAPARPFESFVLAGLEGVSIPRQR